VQSWPESVLRVGKQCIPVPRVNQAYWHKDFNQAECFTLTTVMSLIAETFAQLEKVEEK